jgi:hypothetical protein
MTHDTEPDYDDSESDCEEARPPSPREDAATLLADLCVNNLDHLEARLGPKGIGRDILSAVHDYERRKIAEETAGSEPVSPQET